MVKSYVTIEYILYKDSYVLTRKNIVLSDINSNELHKTIIILLRKVCRYLFDRGLID